MFATDVPQRTWRWVIPTHNQLVRKGRQRRKRGARSKELAGNPQVSGVVARTFVRKPRKPNSGFRKLARVKLRTGFEVTCFIPGERHNVKEHSHVLVSPMSRPDLPGVKYRIIRGVRDTDAPERNKSRSKYGAKRKK